MSNEKKVWVSLTTQSYSVSRYGLQLNFPKSFNYPDYYKLVQEAIKAEKAKDAEKKYEIGHASEFMYRMQKISTDYSEHKPLEELPDSLWFHSKPLPPKTGYLFKIVNGFYILNEACAKILQQFNLGNTTLTPLKIHHPKTQQLISDEVFYLINVAEQREFLTKEQTNLTIYEEYDATWRYTARCSNNMKNYIINIDASATQCDLDLWQDPHLSEVCYFMSDALYQALADARLHKKWNIHPCALV